MSQTRLSNLFNGYVNKTITNAEKDELMQLLSALSDEEIGQLLQDAYDEFQPMHPPFNAATSAALWQSIRQKTDPAIKSTPPRMIKWRYAAAASLLLLCAAGIWLWKTQTITPVLVDHTSDSIHPGRDKATLTLSDGRVLVLDSLLNTDTVAAQNGAVVLNVSGDKISYEAAGSKDDIVTYNTLSTPRGGQYRLVLPDGSEVFLDAASSIRFPVRFTGNERTVELTGQAWFNIKANAAQPFHVQVPAAGKKMDVEVLGTEFNVMAYPDEQQVQTTLLRGSVRVSTDAQEPQLLKPGMQAQFTKNNTTFKLVKPDLQQVMAWKNGQFIFNGQDIRTVMRQLSRWYDINVEYTSDMKGQNFEGQLLRNASIENVLNVLSATGTVHFKINNRTIIVTPQKTED